MINNILNKTINKNGVVTSLPHIQRFVIPGILAAIASSIVQAIGKQTLGDNGEYGPNGGFVNRNSSQQAGEQLLGIPVTMGLALLAGVLAGIVMKLVHKKMDREEHYNDLLVMKPHES